MKSLLRICILFCTVSLMGMQKEVALDKQGLADHIKNFLYEELANGSVIARPNLNSWVTHNPEVVKELEQWYQKRRYCASITEEQQALTDLCKACGLQRIIIFDLFK